MVGTEVVDLTVSLYLRTGNFRYKRISTLIFTPLPFSVSDKVALSDFVGEKISIGVRKNRLFHNAERSWILGQKTSKPFTCFARSSYDLRQAWVHSAAFTSHPCRAL